jgi:hypothetical protein
MSDRELPGAREKADADRLIEVIVDLLEMPDAQWAATTLEGIRDTVARTGYCTEGQQTAVKNIRAAVERRQENPTPTEYRKGSRRYEGHDRGRR